MVVPTTVTAVADIMTIMSVRSAHVRKTLLRMGKILIPMVCMYHLHKHISITIPSISQIRFHSLTLIVSIKSLLTHYSFTYQFVTDSLDTPFEHNSTLLIYPSLFLTSSSSSSSVSHYQECLSKMWRCQ